MVLAGIPSVGLLAYSIATNPLAALLGLVPLFIVGPVLIWMGRLEPEPWSSRLHTFLWGAFVAGFISLVVNTIVAATSGSDVLAAVVSAPFIEELTKAGAIVWMIRRKEVDGIMDGLVYAGWAALGFAVVEDVSYFYLADEQDILWETFVGRALLTPFAHPLFTAWTGLAIGIAIRTRRSIWTAWWGLLLAMGTHAAWNGSLSLAEEEGGAIVAGVAVIAFILLFIATIIGVFVLRRRDARRYAELLPFIATRYAIPPDRIAMLATGSSRRRARQSLPTRDARRRFDDEAGAVARLAAMLDHDGIPSPDHEARLMSQLAAARRNP
ncbi:MAG: RsiW-degrading membrane proteinase PrsW (M82 family) [Verrucomicrobiales bacterium]